MLKKRTILIVTSADEYDNVAQKLASAIRLHGTHNVVVMSDDRYGAVSKTSAIDKLMDSGAQYRYLLAHKDRGVLKDMLKVRVVSKRVNRIKNMVKRFNPEYILCTTQYAHHCVSEAKRKTKFRTPIVCLMQSFTMPKRVYDDATSVYIVENADIKTDLVRIGVRSRNVAVLGLPFDVQRKTDAEKLLAKQELGLPKAHSVFVNLKDNDQLQDVFKMLVDQGEMFSFVVSCENQKLRQTLSLLSQKMPNLKVLFVQSQDRVDECLSVCEVAITQFDIDIIYKCFKLGIVPVFLSKEDRDNADITYLADHKLCLVAKDNYGAIAGVYRALQSQMGAEISQNAYAWVENSSLEKVADFLATYVPEQ